MSLGNDEKFVESYKDKMRWYVDIQVMAVRIVNLGDGGTVTGKHCLEGVEIRIPLTDY